MDRRVLHLDALRGIAVLAVFVEHALHAIFVASGSALLVGRLVEGAITTYFNPGRFGVVLFFMLSGYVIPLSFRGSRPYFDFVVSRTFRLYPAYWASIVCIVATKFVIWSALPPTVQVAANVTMAQKVLKQPDLIGVYWSLFVELLFYGACVALFTAKKLTDTKWLSLATITMILATVIPLLGQKFGIKLPIQFLSHHLSFLFFGGVVRNTLVNKENGSKRWLGLTSAFVAIGIFCASGLVAPVSLEQVPEGGQIGILLAYIIAITVFAASCHFRKPNVAGLAWIGSISYALYLLHTPAIYIARTLFVPNTTQNIIAYLVAALTIAIVASYACFRLVENPAIQLGKRVRFGGKVVSK